MNITFIDSADLRRIRQNRKPEFRFVIRTGKENTVDRYIALLKRDYYGLAGFKDKKEEESFLKQMSLKSDIGIVFEWKDFLKAYLFGTDSAATHPKVYLRVSSQPRVLYDNGIEHDYNRFKKWIKWLPTGYYHTTNLGGGPAPQSIGAGLETLAEALGIEVEWHLDDNRLFFWRKGETCAKKQSLNDTCDGCIEDIRNICRNTNRHAY